MSSEFWYGPCSFGQISSTLNALRVGKRSTAQNKIFPTAGLLSAAWNNLNTYSSLDMTMRFEGWGELVWAENIACMTKQIQKKKKKKTKKLPRNNLPGQGMKDKD